MTISEQQKEDARIASLALPAVVEKLRAGTDVRELASWLAETYEIDDIKAYKWAVAWEQQFESDRRARALRALGLAWPLSGLSAWMLLSIVLPLPPEDLLLSLAVAIPGAIGAFGAFVYAGSARSRACIDAGSA